MPAKTKTVKPKAKKATKTKAKTGSKKAVKSAKKKPASGRKKTTTSKSTTSKKASAKKKPVAKKNVAKKKVTKKKTTSTRKKTTSKAKGAPTIHRSEYISPMTVTPFDAGPSFSQAIDLNDMPSVVDNDTVPYRENTRVLTPTLTSRLSFYMGIFFGAIVLHALMISVLAVMSV